MPRGKPTNAAYWRHHFKTQAASGLKAAEYLRREGIRSSQWYRWRKLLRDGDAGATLVPVQVKPVVGAESEIRVHLPNGIALTFAGVDSPTQLVQALYRLGSE